MKISELTKQIDDLKLELEVMATEETEYATLSEPSRTRFEEHAERLKRFQEMTRELLRLAEETAH